MRRAIVAILVCGVAVCGYPIAASAVAIVDPRDTGGRLDITFVGSRTRDRGETLKVRVETEYGYACRYLRYGGRDAIFVLFDSRNDGDVDLVGRFICVEPHDWEFLLRDIGYAATHPDPGTVVALVDVGALRTPHGSIAVRTRDVTAGQCSQHHVCKDRAPNAGWIRAW